MSETGLLQFDDRAQRLQALQLDRSFLVRAPAGSGKTDLLTRRMLKLLAVVDEPEEVLAITFTRAATAEMRSRVLRFLEQAAGARNESNASSSPADETPELARAALARSAARGWRLLEQPHRLNIETIDSLCLRIAHGQPLLSRMGGRLAPTERAQPLYALAARRTLGRLGGSDASLDEALAHLLQRRDNHLPDCEKLIAGMLAQRDQWLRVFPPPVEDVDWDAVRSLLEQPLRREVRRVLAHADKLLMQEPLLSELLELADYASANGNNDIALLAKLRSFPHPDSLPVDHWRCVARFLLTKENQWRSPKRLNKTRGFPTSGPRQKKRMESLLYRLSQDDNLNRVLARIRTLPNPRYDEDQWQTLRHLFLTLRHAVAELRVIFAEQNAVDFTELGLAAREVLANPEASPDALLALSGNIRHLLVDEFQDTSRSQHDLIRLLLRVWDESDGRTCFLVGDPMQSIYMFRQAEVELFSLVEQQGIVSEEHTVACLPIQLFTNFRSHAGLTDRFNAIFERVFANNGSDQASSVPYSPSFAAHEALPIKAVQIYPQIIGAAGRKPTPEEKRLAQDAEAAQVLEIVGRHRSAIEHALATGGEYRVAILVRARQHLARIVPLLRERGIPFRAVELETLAERQELLDLFSLTRALLHPMDRIAWLSVFRAPWCGLSLRDLHALTGADRPEEKRQPFLDLIERHLPLLADEAQQRARRALTILKQALDTRFRDLHATSFSQWIERTWRSLGGPLCVDEAAYENVQVFFSMLDKVAPDGRACTTRDFATEFASLFAQPDPAVSERAGVQLMTIHKAKGLGFDVVIVPGLDRKPARDQQSLICSLERTDAATGADEVLVAPIGRKGDESHPTYRWVQKQRELRADEERKRLLYVACTRARRELHLLGAATVSASGLRPGDSKSLLQVAWPAFEPYFAGAAKYEGQDDSAGRILGFPPSSGEPRTLEIAASANPRPQLKLRRLPFHAEVMPALKNVTVPGTYVEGAMREEGRTRPEGTRRARIIGSTVHLLIDQLSRGVNFSSLQTLARNHLRTASLFGTELEISTREVLAAVETMTRHREGRWILQQHPDAQSETSWSGWQEGHVRTIRPDRIFRAGANPHAIGQDYLWIIDYKMSAPAGEPIEEFLAKQRAYYGPQLTGYGDAQRALHGESLFLRLGLYYPRLPHLDWWEQEEG